MGFRVGVQGWGVGLRCTALPVDLRRCVNRLHESWGRGFSVWGWVLGFLGFVFEGRVLDWSFLVLGFGVRSMDVRVWG